MNDSRLRLALEKIAPAQWERFERFASEFLASELPDLRTVASALGDKGRDAELFSPVDDPTQVLQYSVAVDWQSKISQTAKRISETLPDVQVLIYVTNQVIGSEGDNLKSSLRKKWRIHLDIRDRSYFLERLRKDTRNEVASENLAKDIVDPYLASEGIVKRSSAFESHETKAAHVYLSLQLRDDLQEKGLTKLSFEALVRSILIGTNSERRVTRAEIKSRMCQLLHNDPVQQVSQLTDSALSRLSKRAVRHWTKQDEFCLTFDESQRLNEHLATQEISEAELGQEIQGVVRSIPPGPGIISPDLNQVGRRLRRILERALHDRAESFASAIMAGDLAAFSKDHVNTVILEDLRHYPAEKGSAESDPGWIEALISEILASSNESIRRYLHDLADAYTVMAFLRQTPDVQSAISEIFSHGEIWLDASAVLPLLAEELFEGGQIRQFQDIVRIATDAGLSFHVTHGVIEEVERHINRCLACSRTNNWDGRLPFLVEAFLQTGRAINQFGEWSEQFRGPNRPVDDVIEFLEERFNIRVQDLHQEADAAEDQFRFAVEEIWNEVHRVRRERIGDFDSIAVNRLSKHDSETYVGIIQRRSQEKPSPFGYSSWWLTFDSAALKVRDRLRQQFSIDPPDSPVISLDFLAQYLVIGPLRPKVPRAGARSLPIIIKPQLVGFLTADLLSEAAQIREEAKNLPDYLVRRRIRDHLDEARRRVGPMSEKGAELVFDEIREGT